MYLHGIGHFHPENEITNEFLGELDIGTSDDWIMERTGIRSRRTVLSLDYIREKRNQDVRAAAEAAAYTNAELGRRAGEMAIARAGIDPSEVGLVIGGGCAPDRVTPAEGCDVAAALDIDAPAFDLRSACTSFTAAVHLLSQMRPDRVPPYVLIVQMESLTRVIDYNDRRSAVLFGDGAAAAVVSASVPGRATFLHCTLGSSPRGHAKVVIPWAGHFDQEGATVQSFAIKRTVNELRAIRKEFDGEAGGRMYFIGHQANRLMLESVCRQCDIPDELHLSNVADFGNTGTAGAPAVLSDHWQAFEAGDQVTMVGVGAGLTWASANLRFEI
ncbi:MAG: ketoacyl-ACP synthase III [Deltaproteobacteria bacterium]|nr:ketoacyl-ACP synthase III [Deltaproteobacteria bacterium]